MTPNSKVILLRFARSLGAISLVSVAAFVVGPGLDLVPDQYDSLVVLVGAPVLLALEKFLRDGGKE